MKTLASKLRILAVSMLCLTVLSACASSSETKVYGVGTGEIHATKVLALGDSMMAWNGPSGQSIPRYLAQYTGATVTDNSALGATFLTGGIATQYVNGGWDWVVINGGGNDLLWGCGCGNCIGTIENLIRPRSRTGKMIELGEAARRSGAKVVFVGYLHSPGVSSAIDGCRNAGVMLESRLDEYARSTPGVYFVSLRDLVPYGDHSFHGADMIHPSPKGSSAVARRIASVILSVR